MASKSFKKLFFTLMMGGVFCLIGATNINQKNVHKAKAETYPDTTIAKSDIYDYKAWGSSKLPSESGLIKSNNYDGIMFTGRYATYTNADTFYLSEDIDGVCYSSFTDGHINGVYAGTPNPGAAKIIGDDPLNLSVTSIGYPVTHTGEGGMFSFGRYPAGNLMYNGIWYYGTYLLEWTDRALDIPNSDWQSLQPFVGFRYSTNKGVSWVDNTNPNAPIFEYPHEKTITDLNGSTYFNQKEILIGAPHFVDFGTNLKYAPVDPSTQRKYAYMVAHGADAGSILAHNSWISGDNVYLIRILMPEGTPAENAAYINNYENWEYYCGEANGSPVYKNWNKRNLSEVYSNIKPIVHSTGYLGNVGVTYNPILDKYFMTLSRAMKADSFDTIILESDTLTGEYRVVQYLEKFAQVSYFMNIPSKFISEDGKTMWLCYSSNYQGQKANIAGSSYSMCLREIRLVKDDAPLSLVYEAESMYLIGDKPNVMEESICSDGLKVGNIYAKDEGIAITNLLSSGDTLAFTYAHGGTYVNQATVLVNNVIVGKVRLNPTGSWQKFTTALFYGSFNKGDKVEIVLLEDDIHQNKLYGEYDEDGNFITDGNYRILGDIDKITVMTTHDKTKILKGSVDIKNRWGIFDYDDGIAGFASGNTAEASDTLKEFEIGSTNQYKIVFNYFASDYPNANPTKRWLNFVINGKRNIIELEAVSGNWNLPLSKEFTITLDEGINVIKLEGEFGPNSCVNADNVTILDLSGNVIATLEAEEGTLNNTGIPAPGIVAGFENRNRPTMDLKVNVQKAGYYTFLIEYASWHDSGNSDTYRYLEIGSNVEGKKDAFKTVKFHRTNDWSHYSTESVVLYLEAGDNIVTFVGNNALGSSINLRKVTITNEIVATNITLSAKKTMVAIGEEIVPILNTNPIDGIYDNISFSIINVTGKAEKGLDGRIIATKKGDVILRAEVTINDHSFIREIKIFIGLLHYEAEDAILGGTSYVTNIYPGYSGTGFVAGFDKGSAEASVTFSSNVESSGSYKLAIRYSAGPLAGSTLDHRVVAVYVNGEKQVINLELTNGWADWNTSYLYCSLNAGENTIVVSTELETNDDCINLDYIEVLDLQKEDKVTVHFVDKNGSEFSSQEVTFGSKVTKPADPIAPEGYSFSGWFTNNEYSQEFDFNTTITKETYIFALFTKLTDKSKLNLTISQCEMLNPDDYESGFEELSVALRNAKEVSANQKATQNQIDQALISLLEAKGNLKIKIPEPKTNNAFSIAAISVSSVLAVAAVAFFVTTIVLRKKKI